jgi:hypothetical protein
LVSLAILACNRDVRTDVHQVQKTEVIISLRALGINRGETFKEVRANRLPESVLAELRGFMPPERARELHVSGTVEGIADAGQPFNATDDVDPRLPMRSLVVAGLSQHYCALSYWEGGIAMMFKTSIFELSDGAARLVWVSVGQGGFNLHDLKEEIESGRMHNELPEETAEMTGALELQQSLVKNTRNLTSSAEF